ncbi:histidinol dehydrogenase [Lysobacter helvus]|uniref:Histidinol dehydrogenase n=2 Tax=Lysobacteraceae TaxID=32033 RepID=A0ABM7Q1L6_9GAMM|nr:MULTISPECIES: histidinol dehydrogenase [Lysobacter]BCT91084.1 histidinol dehydrogenase [Lysobacter caseinilyticus]BCT94237.1 histidinol dehydrogenase [Lysobacter helvus]
MSGAGWQRIDWNTLDARARADVLRRPAQSACVEVHASVERILADVRARGDAALRALTLQFDDVTIDDFAVGEAEFARAMGDVDADVQAAIDDAARRIETFHRAGMAAPYAVDTAPGVRCERVLRPIGRVGLYAPAGSAPLPSTVLMLGIPAQLAGCTDTILCTPPGKDGAVDPVLLVAAQRCGIARVFKVGGAQAIAAMAFGTESIPRCDKVFGPGNAYVTEAKRIVSMQGDGPAIDMPAGPSEVLVIADGGADPRFVAADLLSQAEHGRDSQVLLVSDDGALIEAVEAALQAQLATLPRRAIARAALAQSRAIQVQALADAFDVSNAYAPEHLILAVRTPRAWLPRVRAAGSVFLGDFSPEAIGDYCSGTNHVLPTGGAARAISGLSVASFQTAITVQCVDPAGLSAIGGTAMILARAEGLEAHARAVGVRLEATA